MFPNTFKFLNDNIRRRSISLLQRTTRNMSDEKLSVKVAGTSDQKLSEKVAGMSATQLVQNDLKVSEWNKRLLVFAGRFKTMAEIPERLPFATLDKARDHARIKVANILMALSVVGCVVMVFSGKRAAEKGETISKMNLDWHKEYNDKAKEELAAKK